MNTKSNNHKKSIFPFILLSIGMIGLSLIVGSVENFPGLLSKDLGNLVLNFSNFKSIESQEISKKDNEARIEQSEVGKKVKGSNLGENSDLYEIIRRDFNTLKKSLNTNAFLVSEIIWNIHDEKINQNILSSHLDIQVSAQDSTKNFLEIEVFTNEADNENSTIIQLSYFDRKTKNKIFEITRSYDHKKKPD